VWRKLSLIILLLLGTIVSVLWGAASEQGDDAVVYPVADLRSLHGYSDAKTGEVGATERLYAVVLPGSDMAVVLRPISEKEYTSYQTRAIAYQIIEWDMLAAAFVEPRIEEGDVAGLSAELVSFLKRRVNAISGFAVFSTEPITPPG